MTSGGNNFNDFPENQLTIDFAFLRKPTWGSAIISPFPLVLISFGGNGTFPKKLRGNGVFPRSPQLLGNEKVINLVRTQA